jgi:hypothetical protein
MQTVRPSQQTTKTQSGLIRLMGSVYSALSGGLTYGSPTGVLDSTGCLSEFTTDNVNNTIVRIGANGSTNGQYQWSSGGVAVINHGLQRQPIGFKILDKDGACDIYRTGGAPTNNLIQLTCSVPSVNATVEIF